MDINKTAEYIAAKRKEKNLTQRQLAAVLNVSDKTISKWETAKGLPDVAIIADLCAALDISPTEFFNGEDVDTGNIIAQGDIIIDVAQQYHANGKKEMFCYYTAVASLLFCVVASFFGDGFSKIVMTGAVYITGAIAVYKLGRMNIAELKKLQKSALLLFAVTVIMSVDLGFNYPHSLNVIENDGITIHGFFAPLLVGDYGWTINKFLLLFKNAVTARALVLGQNCYLLSARLKNR